MQERKKVLSWETFQNGTTEFTVQGPDGKPDPTKIISQNGNLSNLQFNGNLLEPYFANRVKDLFKPNSKIENVGLINLDVDGLDIHDSTTKNMSIVNCDMKNANLENTTNINPVIGYTDMTRTSLENATIITTPEQPGIKKDAIHHTNLNSTNMSGIMIKDATIEDNKTHDIDLTDATITNTRLQISGSYACLENMAVTNNSVITFIGESISSANTQFEDIDRTSILSAYPMQQSDYTENSQEKRKDETITWLENVDIVNDDQYMGDYRITIPIKGNTIAANKLTIIAEAKDVSPTDKLGNKQGIGLNANKVYSAHIDDPVKGDIRMPLAGIALQQAQRDDSCLSEINKELTPAKEKTTPRDVSPIKAAISNQPIFTPQSNRDLSFI